MLSAIWMRVSGSLFRSWALRAPDVFLPTPVGLFRPQSGRGLGISPSSAVSRRHWVPQSGIVFVSSTFGGFVELCLISLCSSVSVSSWSSGRRADNIAAAVVRQLEVFPCSVSSSGSLLLSASSCTPFGFPYTAASPTPSLQGPWPPDFFFSPDRCSSLLWWARASTRVLTCSAISSLEWRRHRLLSGLPGVARPFFRRPEPVGGLFLLVSVFPPWQLSEMPPSWLFTCCIVFPELRYGASLPEVQERLQYPVVTGGSIFVCPPVLYEGYCLWACHRHVYVWSPSSRLERVGIR